MLTVKYHEDGKGYTISFNAEPVYVINNNPEGGDWTTAEMKAHADKMLRIYHDNMIVEPIKGEIRPVYEELLNKPFVGQDGAKWNASFEDVQKMHSAVQLVETALQLIPNTTDEVILYDSENNGHTKTVAEAKMLLLQMGKQLATYLGRKQHLYKMISDPAVTEEVLNKVQLHCQYFLENGEFPPVPAEPVPAPDADLVLDTPPDATTVDTPPPTDL